MPRQGRDMIPWHSRLVEKEMRSLPQGRGLDELPPLIESARTMERPSVDIEWSESVDDVAKNDLRNPNGCFSNSRFLGFGASRNK